MVANYAPYVFPAGNSPRIICLFKSTIHPIGIYISYNTANIVLTAYVHIFIVNVFNIKYSTFFSYDATYFISAGNVAVLNTEIPDNMTIIWTAIIILNFSKQPNIICIGQINCQIFYFKTKAFKVATKWLGCCIPNRSKAQPATVNITCQNIVSGQIVLHILEFILITYQHVLMNLITGNFVTIVLKLPFWKIRFIICCIIICVNCCRCSCTVFITNNSTSILRISIGSGC